MTLRGAPRRRTERDHLGTVETGTARNAPAQGDRRRSGSVQSIVSDVGNSISTEGGVLDTYRYTEYGEFFFRDGNGAVYAPNASAGEQDFTYTGREWTAEVGMYYDRARWYRAEVGAFAQRDVLVHFAASSTCLYVGNSPTAFVDWDGRKPTLPKPAFREKIRDACDAPKVDKVCADRAARLGDGWKCKFEEFGGGRSCVEGYVHDCEAAIQAAVANYNLARNAAQKALDEAWSEASSSDQHKIAG